MGPTGKYFYVDLIDTTGEIRAMAYNSEADRLYKKLEVYSVYLIENGKIQKENKNFTTDNNFEIIFNEHSVIIKQESNDNAPKLGKLLSKEKDSSVASQSQHNALLEDRSQNSIAKDKVFEIDKRLKEIKKEELVLAMEKLDLKYEKKFL
ncbi:replication protein A 70 kDa DNA-binding subunit-like isoform X2 [Metopolophium dirhodum]|nr:replication protein A 70 kDa DNA-binding subunit-like isoform X2 [Metopolophium dirhodum]